MRHLIMRLEAPFMSFGGVAVDGRRGTERFPGASMLTGLLGNAMGWHWTDSERLEALQSRLAHAVRIDRSPAGDAPVVDFQTVQISHLHRSWTTRGYPQKPLGGPATYQSPHLRYRDYMADMVAMVALRLRGEGPPYLDDLADALCEPARPLYIGRKSCVPAEPVFSGFAEGDTAVAALLSAPLVGADSEYLDPKVEAVLRGPYRRRWSSRPRRRLNIGMPGLGAAERAASAPPAVLLFWPEGEGSDRAPALWSRECYDWRNWRLAWTSGARIIHEGRIEAAAFPVPDADDEEVADAAK